MKNSGVRFVVFLVVGAVIGFFGTTLFSDNGSQTNQDVAKSAETQSNDQSSSQADDQASKNEETAAIPAEAEIFKNKGCIQCHSISGFNLDGGKIGPDLTHAYGQMEDKHGMTLDEFLQNPNSAVMSSVLSSQITLSDEDRQNIVSALKDVDKNTKE